MTTFAVITTTIDLAVSAGTNLIIADGVIVAVVPEATAVPVITTASKRVGLSNKPPLSDAFDKEILAKLNTYTKPVATYFISNDLNIPSNDKTSRGHIGMRLKLMAKKGLITSFQASPRSYIYYSKKGE